MRRVVEAPMIQLRRIHMMSCKIEAECCCILFILFYFLFLADFVGVM